MKEKGAIFVVSREALTYEFVPEYRTKLNFIFSRFFQRGNNYGLMFIEKENNNLKVKFFILLRATLAVLIYGSQLIIFSPIKKKWIFSFINFSLNLGKISTVFGKKYYIYRNENKFVDKFRK